MNPFREFPPWFLPVILSIFLSQGIHPLAQVWMLLCTFTLLVLMWVVMLLEGMLLSFSSPDCTWANLFWSTITARCAFTFCTCISSEKLFVQALQIMNMIKFCFIYLFIFNGRSCVSCSMSMCSKGKPVVCHPEFKACRSFVQPWRDLTVLLCQHCESLSPQCLAPNKVLCTLAGL